MALWFDALDSTAAAAIVAAFLTALGFVVAFGVAHSSWRSQRRTELRLAAGEEIFNFFRDATNSIGVMRRYAELLIEVRAQIERGEDVDVLAWNAKCVLELTPQYLSAQRNVRDAKSRVYDLLGKHHLVLVTQPGASIAFEKARKYLYSATENMFFIAPSTNPNTDYIVFFLSRNDDPKWQMFAVESDRNDSMCVAAAAALRSMYQLDVVRPNLWWTLSTPATARTLFPDPSDD